MSKQHRPMPKKSLSYAELLGAYNKLQAMYAELYEKFMQAVEVMNKQQEAITAFQQGMAKLREERNAAVATTTMNVVSEAWKPVATDEILSQLDGLHLQATGDAQARLAEMHKILSGGDKHDG